MDAAGALGGAEGAVKHRQMLGLQAGLLKQRIATRLLRMPEVKTFKNEYHARYGYGATEVIFE